jgi:hypothetical protein
MITQMDIVNLALFHLKTATITSINELTPTAKKVKTVYNIALDSVLKAHAWSFANKHELLSIISDESIPGWDFLYMYPSDCLQLRKIYQEDNVDPSPVNKFEIAISPDTQTQAIAANIEEAWAKYTMRVSDHSKFTAEFSEAFALYLAANLAQPITGDAKLAASVFAMYRMKIDEAKKSNMNEKQNFVSQSCSFIDAR